MDTLLNTVRSILITTPARWKQMTQVLPGKLLARPPAEGQWSAVECLQHLIDTESIFQFRLKAFRAGQDFPAFNPDAEGNKPGDRSPAELAAEFAHLREASMGALEAITVADLDRQARHQELGPVTLREMVNNWAAHDLNHTVQAERALMQPFIRESGPWGVYFKDHAVG